MKPDDYIRAARVPESLKPQSFGPWRIERWRAESMKAEMQKFPIVTQFKLLSVLHRVGFDSYTMLRKYTWATMHLGDESQTVVMEDSQSELRKHLPIWLHAKGNVLVTGLGLGCVVRGLLANPDVDHITVVEIDEAILRIVGHEFRGNRKVTMVHCDAFAFSPAERFDYAWHDLFTDGETNLQVLHAQLLKKFCRKVVHQGAWEFPPYFRRRIGRHMNLLFR